jgi:hypothetical protein
VRKLLLDTNVLLELALFDLARTGNRSARSDLFKTPARHFRFMQEIENRFGRMLYSVGSIIELDRLALSMLTRGNRQPGALDPFWTPPDKPGLQVKVNNWQTGSNMLLGAGLLMAAVTAGLFAARF